MDSTDPYEFGHPLLTREFPGSPPCANLGEVNRLIGGARDKIELYERCIAIEETLIADLDERLRPFKSLDAYLARADERKRKMTGLFRSQLEYGLPAAPQTEELSQVRAQSANLQASSNSKAALVADLKSRIEFLKEDIEMLESIKMIDSAQRISDQGLSICS